MNEDPHQRTPSNTSRKRMPASVNRSTVTSGHVAQMQRMFQSAKASLGFDMAFAASPTGSIGSRLPPDRHIPSHSSTSTVSKDEKTQVKDWRYSLAPQLLAASDVDVREPLPERSPTLPVMLGNEDELDVDPATEPLSSGFNSPAGGLTAGPRRDTGGEHHSQLEACDASQNASSPLVGETELAKSMTRMRVCSDDENIDMDLDESPIITHLKRMSADTPSITQYSESDDKEIFMSEPAEAAAQSAKAKRSLLRRLFPRRDHGSSPVSECQPASPSETASDQLPCPDPSLHKLISMGTCPDPVAHLRTTPPNLLNAPMISITPEAAIALAQHTPSTRESTLLPPAPPFHRASSTGSPMPFIRPHTAKSSPGPMYDAYRQSNFGQRPSPHPRSQPPYRPATRNGHPGMASEHFQPGWYYAQEPAQPAERLNPMTYSFSTAAAKVEGQSAAPDSEIRDSYRTDTLTVLAKPPSRYRKTGMGALASAHGIGKYYDGPDRMNSRATRPDTSRSHRPRNNIQFRSSPPRAPEHMDSGHQKRRRPRELEDDSFDVHEDEADEAKLMGSAARLRASEEPIEVDEATRAAVRMSLYGPETPEALQGEREGLKEISPNVTSWRKGMRQPKKKRKPSYWDGDLKQIRESPAGRQEQVRSLQPGAERHVTTSPAKEDVESMRVSVRDSVLPENPDMDVENLHLKAEEEMQETMMLAEDELPEPADAMDIEVAA